MFYGSCLRHEERKKLCVYQMDREGEMSNIGGGIV